MGEGKYMKKLLIALFFVPSLSFALPASFNFNDVSILAFSQATFKSLLRVDYVITPEVLAMDRRITISVKDVPEAEAYQFVEGILQQQGISIDRRGSVLYLVPSAKLQSQQFFPSSPTMQPARPAEQQVGHLPDPVGTPVLVRPKADETDVYQAANRSSDFLASVVVGAFGPRAAVAVAGNVVLTGTADDLVKMRKLLVAVDSAPALVDVSASWIEVADNGSDGRGISLVARVLGARFGVTLGSVTSGSVMSVKTGSFELVIDALKQDGRFRQVSNSRLVGDDYETLQLNVGDETPTVSSSGRDNSGNAVQNIVYRPSGVIVDVQPKVLGSGRLQLGIDGQISNFKPTTSGVTGSPTLVKRQVKTKVTVADGEVLLIGGLSDQQSTSSSSAFSFLPTWSAKSSSHSNTDLVLVLSAKVVK